MDEPTRQPTRIEFEALHRESPIRSVRWMAGLALLAHDGAMCREEMKDCMNALERYARLEPAEFDHPYAADLVRKTASSVMARIGTLIAEARGGVPGAPGGPVVEPGDDEDDCAPVLGDPPRELEPGGEVTHVVMLLDRSSSMRHCRKETVDGFNLQVARLRETAATTGKRVLVTLISFGGTLELKRFARPVEEIEDLSLDEYRCGIGTRLLDAFGFAFDTLARHVPDGDGVDYVLVAVTDGEESSSLYRTWRGIADMIRARRCTGRWSFAYVGPDERVQQAAGMLRLSRGEVMGYSPDPEGTSIVMDRLSNVVSRHVTLTGMERFRAGMFLGEEESGGPVN